MMVGILDTIALLMVAVAVIFLVRGARRRRCGATDTPKAGIELRIPLAQMRASARRAAGRG